MSIKFIDLKIQDLIALKKRNVHIVAFGAGKALDTFIEYFSAFHVETYIEAVVDNSSKFHGGGGEGMQWEECDSECISSQSVLSTVG